MSDEPMESIAFLCRSPARVGILERVVEGPTRPSDLVDSAAVSRTTVHRTLTELVDRGWVCRADGDYCVTGTGRKTLEAYEDAVTRFRTVDRLTQFWNHVDAALGVQLEWLADATVRTATDQDPHRPLEWYADQLETLEGDRLRGLLPVVNSQLLTLYDRLLRDGTRLDVVVQAETAHRAHERYGPTLLESLASDGDDLTVTTEALGCGLTLYGETVLLAAYDAGHLVAVVRASHPDLEAWAEDRFHTYRADSRPITDTIDVARD